MKMVAIMLAWALAATPALAQQPIADAAQRAAARAGAAESSHPAVFWSGVALAAAGATLAVLGTTAFKSDDGSSGNTPKGSFQACEALKSNPVYAGNRCDVLKGPNKPLVWGGVAAAAVGLGLIAVGVPHGAIQFGPGAIRVEQRLKF